MFSRSKLLQDLLHCDVKYVIPGPDDYQITVKFSNGKTEKVACDRAVWIPEQVFDRLVLELRMPSEAREALQSEPEYPQETFPGYPTSGVEAQPEEYKQPLPMYFDESPVLMEGSYWPYYPYTLPPSNYKNVRTTERITTKTAVNSDEMNKLVPGKSFKGI